MNKIEYDNRRDKNYINLIFKYLIVIIIFIESIFLFFGIDTYSGKTGTIKGTTSNAIIHFVLGVLLFFIIKYFFKEKKYKICTKCEESYNSSDLKDDICPNCDIKTVNLEGYFDKKR